MGQNGVTGQLGFVFVVERKKGGGTWQIVTKKLDDDDDNDSTKGEKKNGGFWCFCVCLEGNLGIGKDFFLAFFSNKYFLCFYTSAVVIKRTMKNGGKRSKSKEQKTKNNKNETNRREEHESK